MPDGEDFSLTQPGQAGYSRKAAAVQMKSVPKGAKPSACAPEPSPQSMSSDIYVLHLTVGFPGSPLGASTSTENTLELPAALSHLEAMFEGQLDATIVREVVLGLGGSVEAACDALLQMTGQGQLPPVEEAGAPLQCPCGPSVCLAVLPCLKELLPINEQTCHACCPCMWSLSILDYITHVTVSRCHSQAAQRRSKATTQLHGSQGPACGPCSPPPARS